MGCCCSLCSRRREPSGEIGYWKEYSDREEPWIPPKSRRERMRPGTTSMSSGELKAHAEDDEKPNAALAAKRELRRRGYDVM